MKREVIIACDFCDRESTLAFLKKFGNEKPYLKIGMELYYREGAPLVRELKNDGYKIFLDLKLHDIPNTVYKAAKNLALIGADMLNVHAAGGIEMMKAAKRGISEGAAKNAPLLIAVTQLTSTSAEVLKKEILVDVAMEHAVEIYAQNAKAAGLDGVVCSAFEARSVKDLGLLAVTPGIRFESDSKDDQKRVATPALAKELGSDFIVVGRSITAAENPLEAYFNCVKQFN